jgi:hypothetical protein
MVWREASKATIAAAASSRSPTIRAGRSMERDLGATVCLELS